MKQKVIENVYATLDEGIQVVSGQEGFTWHTDNARWVNAGKLKASQAPVTSEKYYEFSGEDGWKWLCKTIRTRLHEPRERVERYQVGTTTVQPT